MLDFTYYAPTKVYFGRGKENEVGKIIKELGYKKIMLQYGKSSIKKSGLYDRVMKSLDDAGISVVEMGGVEPNPKLSFVREAVKVARENGVELVLAVGGGSVIDSSKMTAIGAMGDNDVWDYITRKATPTKALPVGCILTLAAAGSEMSASAVLTDIDNNMKRGLNTELNRMKFAICNPELTYSVSPYQTGCGIVDIMAHTLERYFTVCEPTDLTDRIAESVLKAVVNAGRVLVDNPEDYDARANMMWASSLSHNDLTGCGRENMLAVHQIEHGVSGAFDEVAHGAGLAVLFPAWSRYVYKANPSRFAQLARRVWDVVEEDDVKAALLGIEEMEKFFSLIGMPLRLREFGIDKDAIPRIADLTTFGKTRSVKSQRELDYDAIIEILESCY